MADIPREAHKRMHNLIAALREDRQPWWQFWRDLARYITPRRYISLESEREHQAYTSTDTANVRTGNRRAATLKNPDILDSTGTLAARTLAAGMMNGITSPSRPWFRLTIPGLPPTGPAREWLDIVQETMLEAMGRSNFYNAMGTVYTDLSTFGTAAMMVYEDFDDVFRCYNYALGEYYLEQDNRQIVRRFAREFYWRADQMVREFGLDNVSQNVRDAFLANEGRRQHEYKIVHLIEPNDVFEEDLGVPRIFQFREVFWEAGQTDGKVLRVRGFRDWPAVCPRWDIVGNDSYGTGPSADALPDIRQLQHMAKRKAQGMDKLISPPVVADIQLQGRPAALMPNGITYVSGSSSVGVKPLYTVQPPLQEINIDIARLQERIREVFHNDLFRMISNIDVGRTTATEIDARREEKLVLLGPVLERFENEALDPVVKRIFSIMQRRALFPPPPPELDGLIIDVEYVSLLQDAQRAVGAIPMERFAAFVGNLGGAVPDVMEVPDWQSLVSDYGTKIGVAAKHINSPEVIAQRRQAREALQAIQAAGQAAQPAAEAAKTASETSTEGQNLLTQLLGGQ